MRLALAFAVGFGVLILAVIVFGVLAVPEGWNALGTVLAVWAGIAFYRANRKESPIPEGTEDS